MLLTLAGWRLGTVLSMLVLINNVAAHRAWRLLGWVTLGGILVHSAVYPPWDSDMSISFLVEE